MGKGVECRRTPDRAGEVALLIEKARPDNWVRFEVRDVIKRFDGTSLIMGRALQSGPIGYWGRGTIAVTWRSNPIYDYIWLREDVDGQG